MNAKILVVEDDELLRDGLSELLSGEGYCAYSCSSCEEAEKALEEKRYDLIILDVMLPDGSGYDLCRKLREAGVGSPVLFLTACDDEIQIVRGLDCGADDYVTKPFGVMELIARIKAVLRRSNKIMLAAATDSSDLSAGNGLLKLNYDFHKVYVNDDEVTLTLKEFELLYYLLKNKNIVISRDKIMDEVWDYNYAAETRTVDVHIKTLRHKLGPASKLIETIRGVGYKIVD